MGASLNGGGGRTSRDASRRSMSEINVTPMVDVMLVLLIIFMVAAPMMTAGVNVDLPQTTSDPLPGTDEPLTISVNSKGEVFLQETKIPLDELTPKLTAIAKEKKDTRIFIRGDRKLDYGRMMEVVGVVNGAGFTRVAFVTEAVDKR